MIGFSGRCPRAVVFRSFGTADSVAFHWWRRHHLACGTHSGALTAENHRLGIRQNIAEKAAASRCDHAHEYRNDERRTKLERDMATDNTEGGQPQSVGPDHAPAAGDIAGDEEKRPFCSEQHAARR